MRIVRGPRRDYDFTQLPNAMLRNGALSYRARGLLASLLSHVDGWETDSERLAERGKEGRDAVRTALRELESAGYLIRRKHQDSDTGTWSTAWQVNEEPTTDFQSSVVQSSDSQSLYKNTKEEDPPTPSDAGGQSRPDEPCSTTTQPHRNCRHCGTNRRARRESTRPKLPPKCDRCDVNRMVELPSGALDRCSHCGRAEVAA